MRGCGIGQRCLLLAAMTLPAALILWTSITGRSVPKLFPEDLGVSEGAFEKIVSGMSYKDVRRIIGADGIDIPGRHRPFDEQSLSTTEITGKWKLWRSPDDQEKWMAVSFLANPYADDVGPVGSVKPTVIDKVKSGFKRNRPQ
jgi:hypothetical protein